MGVRASYLVHAEGGGRDALSYNPEFSRRARGFAVYAAIRALGSIGVADLVERSCALARRFADRLSAAGVEVLNEVVLNQVLVRFRAADGDHDRYTRRVVQLLQRDGTCWMSGTTWNGMAVVRISVSNWSTDQDDVDRSVTAILAAAATAASTQQLDRHPSRRPLHRAHPVLPGSARSVGRGGHRAAATGRIAARAHSDGPAPSLPYRASCSVTGQPCHATR